MALQTSGAISLNDIHIEAGGSSGTTCTINDSDIRGLIGKASGATMSFNEWYGASGIQTSNMTLDYFYDVGTYITTRRARYRNKTGQTDEGSMSPDFWYMPNGNRLYITKFQVNYPSNGTYPSGVEVDGYMRNSSNTAYVSPSNYGWDTLKFVSNDDGRFVIAKRTEMSYVTGQSDQGVYDIRWTITATANTTTDDSTLYFEYINFNDESGVLEITT